MIDERENLHTTQENEQPTSDNGSQTTRGGQPSSENHNTHVVVEGEVVDEEVSPPGDQATTSEPQQPSQAEAQAEEYKDQWLRAVADFKNYKRRAEMERDELKRNANANLILKLLPILDDFELAIGNVPPEVAETPWWEGTTMITQKFRMLLESEGVTPIEAVGHEFDPNLHHAVSYEEIDGQNDKVIEELQKGYKLRDRVLRPAMVKVGKSQ
jgi:molecular chaperone GrpE